jgi:SAM-dependent methyltransferase
MNKVIERWNDKYAPDELVFGNEPNQFLTTQTHLFKPNGSLLAIGDGEGRNGVWLAEQGFHVLSVDGAQNGVNKAVKQAQARGVSDHFKGYCVDLLKWDWPINAFDTVVNLHVHFMPDERALMCKAMGDALNPGGIFLQEVFHPDQATRDSGGPSDPLLCVTLDDLKQDFAEFEILHLEECERDIKPANFHPGGLGKVCRIVARKV